MGRPTVPLVEPVAGNDELHIPAPVLTVRFGDDGPVASSLTGRPGPLAALYDLGDGVFAAPDPDYRADQMFVPLDHLRLEALHLLVERAPCSPDDLIDALVERSDDAPADRADLERLFDQLRAAGLIAPAAGEQWSRLEGLHRADRIAWDHEHASPPSVTLDLTPGRAIRRTDHCALLVTPQGFELRHADGATRAVLDALDVLTVAAVGNGKDAARARDTLNRDRHLDLSREPFEDRLRTLAQQGLLENLPSDTAAKVAEAFRNRAEAFERAEDAVRRAVADERERREQGGVARPIVVAVDADSNPLLALGTILAYAMAHEGGRLHDAYYFAPILFTAPQRFTKLFADLSDWPVIFLFSDYIWTREANLAMSAMVKEHLPSAITIHGGPEMPKYEDDAATFFADNPSVDIGVRGEGEATLAALLEALVPAIPDWMATGQVDLGHLADVEGLTYRGADGLVRTGDRDRIVDIDTIPSPYLTGLFDEVGRRESDTIILETNRGCPYGCTFCDWGSATLSRIRKFSLQRVKDEMEWAAKRGIANFGVADANFGILERDVEIAEWAVELKARYGVPREFQVTYAKNRVKNLVRIVRLLAEAGIVTQAAVSVQTMDKQVLQIVKRKNLSLDQHVPLVQEFEDLNLPIYSDIMLGLPGSTVDTTRGDLQFCIDREIHYRPNPTQLLVNSPMNDEAYRREYGIVARPREFLLESATYTREDMRVMSDLAEYLLLADRRGTLRELATYVRRELRIPEMQFYEMLIDAGRDSRRWPHLAYLNTVAARTFIPPGSWSDVVEEIGQFMVDLGVPDDDALATVLAVQRALIPIPGRSFPETLHLPHDYAAWHAGLRASRKLVPEGMWVDHIEPLRSFGPGTLEIDDSTNACGRVIGVRPRGYWAEIIWELESPVARGTQRAKAAAA